MSEQATEQLPPQQFQDEMHELQFGLLNGLIEKRNDLVGRFNAASGDRVTLTEQIKESNDPDIAAARELWAQAYEELMALVTPKVNEIINNAQGSTESIEKDIKELDAKLKPGVTYFKKMYGENAAKYFASQERVKGAIRAGGGGKRVRGFDVIVTIDGEDRQFENAASAAKYIGSDVETSDLQKAFFEKTGVDASKDAPDVVSLTIEFTDVDGDGNKTEREAFVKFIRSSANVPEDARTPVEDEDEVEDVVLDEDDDLSNF
jgi:hypothetical protein